MKNQNNNSVVLTILGLLIAGLAFGTGALVFNEPQIDVTTYETTIEELKETNKVLSSEVTSLKKELESRESETSTENEISFEDEYLNSAIDEIFDRLGDKDSFLTCGTHTYNEDEVSVSDVKEWAYWYYDDDRFAVLTKLKLVFDDDSDERDCKDTRVYSVIYDEDENRPEVTRLNSLELS